MGLRERLFGSMTIATDNDGVLVDSAAIVVAKVNKRLGTDITREDIVRWGWVGEETPRLIEAARRAIDLGDEDPRGLAIELEWSWYDPENMGIAPPDPVVMSVVRDCRALGISQIFPTSRMPACEGATREWFEEHLPWAAAERKYFVRPGSMLGMDGDVYKIGIVWLHGADVFFDDHGPTVRRCRMLGIPAYLVNQPWNREDVYIPYQWRVERNWLDMMSVITRNFIIKQLSSLSSL